MRFSLLTSSVSPAVARVSFSAAVVVSGSVAEAGGSLRSLGSAMA